VQRLPMNEHEGWDIPLGDDSAGDDRFSDSRRSDQDSLPMARNFVRNVVKGAQMFEPGDYPTGQPRFLNRQGRSHNTTEQNAPTHAECRLLEKLMERVHHNPYSYMLCGRGDQLGRP
jgi:hypothetical protein